VILIATKIELIGPWAMPLSLQEISPKSVHNFFSYPTNRQTDKETDKQTEVKA